MNEKSDCCQKLNAYVNDLKNKEPHLWNWKILFARL